MIDQNISHYKILEKLGEGGMGIVYKAQDTKLDRIVALKFLPPNLTTNETDKARFMQEAKAAAALNHPNVCVIHDIQEIEGQQFIVMEYVDGLTLREKIPLSASQSPPLSKGDTGGLSFDGAIDYAIQIAEALQAAHEQSIIHRDIKSENIMVNTKNQIKVMDFGLAKLKGSLKLTKTSSTLGTVAYMSPEQIQGQEIDARSDIFSFGVVLYEMLTGKLPFKGDYEAAMTYAIVNEAPEPVQKHRPDLSSEFLHVLNRALEKDVENRYQSMKDVLIDLKRIRRDKQKSFHLPTDEPIPEVTHTEKIQTKNRRLLWLIACVTTIILIIIVKFIFIKPSTLLPPKTSVLTSYEGSEYYPALSPDGCKLAFIWNGPKQDNWDIYIKVIGEEGFQRLTNDSAVDYSATWSNDGNSIIFIRGRGIYRKSILGERETKLYSFAQSGSQMAISSSVEWSPDGEWLVFNDVDSSGQHDCIFMLNLTTIQKKQLTFSGPGYIGDMNPKFSPDGQIVAFQRVYSYDTRDLFILNLKNGKLQQLTFDRKNIYDLAWTQNGKQIVFSSNRDGGIFRLWRISITSDHPEAVEPGGQNVSLLSISRNGHRLAYVTGAEKRDIWKADIQAQQSNNIKPNKFISSSKNDEFPVYSPDGQRIAFGSNRTGYYEIYVCNSDGSNPVQLTSLNSHSNVPRWSPSGASIVFDSRPDGNSDILIIDAEGIKPPQNLTKHPADDSMPTWSTDGQSIYFNSNRSGEYQIYRMSLNSNEVVQITKNLGFFGYESADGQYFYFKKSIKQISPIFQIDLKNGKETVVIDEQTYIFSWIVKPEGIYYIPFNEDEQCLKFYKFVTGSIEQIGILEKRLILSDISNDSQHILFWYYEDVYTDIYLVDNFR